MSVQVSYKKQTVLGIILLLIIFFVVESVANIWWNFQIECEFEDNEIFQNMELKEKKRMCNELYNIRTSGTELIPNQKSEFLNINSHGFRGQEIELEKSNQTYRIFMVGGSTMFGMGATSDQTTIPGYTQMLVNTIEVDYDIEVINAGIQNANTKTERNLIEQKIIKFNPDLIIMYDGWNDLREGFDSNTTIKNWNAICDLGIKNNIDVIVSLQPIAGFGNKILTEQELNYSITGLDYKNNILKDNIQNYNTLSEQISTLENCTETIDMRSEFDKIKEPVYWDQGHISDKGNSIISKSFFKHIIKIIDNKKIENINTFEEKIEKENFDLEQNIINILSYYKTPIMINSLFNNNQNEKIYSNEVNLETQSKSYKDMNIAIQIKVTFTDNEPDNKKIEIKTIDKNRNKYLENSTYFIKISKDDNDILREHFFSEDESLIINILSNNDSKINIEGHRNYEHNALNDDFNSNEPIKISGSLLNLGDYNFTIDILTIENSEDWIFSLTDFNTILSIKNYNNNQNFVNVDKKVSEIKNQTNEYDLIKFISITESNKQVDNTFDLVLKENAQKWKTGEITDEEFISYIKTRSNENQFLVNPIIEKGLPEWLANNAGWTAATILTNGELSKINDEYTDDEIYPCNEKYIQNPNYDCWDFKINSQGLRNSEITAKKSDDIFRIVALGGSTTFTGETNEKTWPGQLQRIINEKINNINVEVINAGKSGATTNNELEFIKNNLEFLDPDLIIMYDGWNDSISVDVGKTIQNWNEVCQISKDNNISTTIIIQPLPISGQRILTDQEVSNVLNPVRSSSTEYQKISQQYVNSFIELNNNCTQTLDFRGIFDYIDAPIYYDGGHILNHGSIILSSNIFTSISPEFFKKSFNIQYNYLSDEFENNILYAVQSNFQNKNMNNLDLKNAIFDKAELNNVSLINSDLRESRFVFANLSDSNLSGADLTGANTTNLSINQKWLICKWGFEILPQIQDLPGDKTLKKFITSQC